MSHYRQDYHTHTGFSIDSEAGMEAVCQAAIAAEIDEMALTDHLEFGPDVTGDPFPTNTYLAAIERCRERFRGKLIVRAGIEVGEPHLFADEAAAVVAQGGFDVVLGSAHYAEGMRAAWLEDFFDQPLRDAYASYFRQVVDLAAKGEFDILCHLDLIKRDARKFGKPYDGPGPYAEMIRAALESVVERGRGIELNTSPLRRGQTEPCPSLEILRWYRELGGEILTLGSDAHRPEVVGADIDVAMEMAKSVGFDRLATFERRQITWKGL
jgi:histidinol-phosphatase (PHP family)